MAPTWLTALAWVALVVAFGCAAAILVDIFGRRRRQRMWIMEAVWPITALYLGPVGLWAYASFGRAASGGEPEPTGASSAGQDGADAAEPDSGADGGPDRGDPPGADGEGVGPTWQSVFSGVAHCGGGCTLGDIVAETAVFLFGLELLGTAFGAELVGDYVLALGLGIVFQYFAIAPMRGLSLGDGLVAAAKADVLSLTAFEVGLFGWMALMRFVFFTDQPLQPDQAAYWFLMQVGMALGFVTAWPMNVWLIRRGIKEAM